MIESTDDYEFYLESDKIALDIRESGWQEVLIDDKYRIWKFQRLLRKLEYYVNCKPHQKSYIQYLQWRFYKEGRKLGFSIHPNVFGPGLSIAHCGTLIANGNVRVGENCRIHNCVHLATQAGSSDACPTLGNNIFISAGAVIFGKIQIADNIVIGANSVVNRSFLEEGITIAGNPARKISNNDSHRYYGRATETVRAKGSVHIVEYSDNNLLVRNTGTQTWTKDTPLRIGVVGDRSSVCYHPSWMSQNRVCTFCEHSVRPGETATFSFEMSPGSETFQLVMEKVCWIPATEFTIAKPERRNPA
jgi:serine O-acetyltransferase